MHDMPGMGEGEVWPVDDLAADDEVEEEGECNEGELGNGPGIWAAGKWSNVGG
jgi:hypothetical protein